MFQEHFDEKNILQGKKEMNKRKTQNN